MIDCRLLYVENTYLWSAVSPPLNVNRKHVPALADYLVGLYTGISQHHRQYNELLSLRVIDHLTALLSSLLASAAMYS